MHELRSLVAAQRHKMQQYNVVLSLHRFAGLRPFRNPGTEQAKHLLRAAFRRVVCD